MKTPRFPPLLTACFLLLALIGWPLSLRAAGWSTEKVSVGAVVVNSVNLRPWKDGVLVSGIVTKQTGYAYQTDAGYFLQIDVLDAHGAIINTLTTDYLPRIIPIVYRGIPARSSYAAHLRPSPPAGSTIRVSSQGGPRPPEAKPAPARRSAK